MVARPSMSKPNCDPNRLLRLLEDRLEEEEQTAMARHLEACASCRRDLEHLAAESRWWGDARLLAGEPTGPEPEPTGDEPAPLDFLGPPAEPGQLGTLGTYEVIEIIGRGGMGLVLKAFDRPLGRFVAVKVLAPELATSASARRRFAREARAAAAICHDHIVAIHAVDETPSGLPFLVMPCVAGRSLQDRLDRVGPLGLREVLRIGMQAASGLAAAHAVGLVHRDVKPANILLENCVERVKLTDFGLARAVDDASLTQSGVVAGTPQYMAPEQARGESVDARADLFSLGSVLYALCTGRPPFRAETTMGVLRRVCEDAPRPIVEINPEVPDWFAAIVAKLQAKDPADRFGSAAEVADLLGRCLAYLERPDATAPPFLPARPPAPPRRRARSGMFAAVAVVAVLAGLGASEASGVTHLADFVATVLRFKTPDGGTLVLQVDDPEVKVRVDGEDVVLSGAGPQEIRLNLRAGQHQVETSKDGAVERELVTITRGGKQIVRATLEPQPKPDGSGRIIPVEPQPKPDAPARVIPPPEDAKKKFYTFQYQLVPIPVQDPAKGVPPSGDARKLYGAFIPDQSHAPAIDPATVERLEARIKALEGQLQTREQTNLLIEARSQILEQELKQARERLARLSQSAKAGNAQVIAKIKDRIRELEGELRLPSAPPDAPGDLRPEARKSAGAPFGTARKPGSIKLPRDLERDIERDLSRILPPISPDPSEPAPLEETLKALRARLAEIKRVARDPDNDPGFRHAAEKIRQLEEQLARSLPPTVPDGSVLVPPSPPQPAPLEETLKAARDRLNEMKNLSLHNAAALRYAEEQVRRLEAGDPGADPALSAALRYAEEQVRRLEELRARSSRPVKPGPVPPVPPVPAVPSEPGLPPLPSLPNPPSHPITPEQQRGEQKSAKSRRRKAPKNDSVTLSSAVFSVAVSPDGKTVAFGCFDGVIGLYDTVSRRLKTAIEGHASSVRSLAFSPDGTLLAAAGGDYRNPEGTGEVKLLDLDPEGRLRGERELKGHTSLVWSVAFSPDGKTLATGSWDRTARLWDVATGETRAVLEGHTDGVRCVAFRLRANAKAWNDTESRVLATAGFDGDVKFWNVAPNRPDYGKLLHSYHASDFGLSSIACSPDGRTLAISLRPSFTEVRPDDVILLDMITWKERARLKGHRQGVISVAFSPDGKTLASGGGAFEVPERFGEVFLWDVATGRAKGRFTGLKFLVESLAFSPDGKALVSGGGVRDHGGEVRFWDPTDAPGIHSEGRKKNTPQFDTRAAEIQ